MTIEEIKNIIESMALPSAYRFFRENEVPQLPYNIWYLDSSANFGADDKVYTRIDALIIEHYSAYKDFDGEAALEAVLDAAHLFWNKTETYLNTEHMFLVTYEMEVLING